MILSIYYHFVELKFHLKISAVVDHIKTLQYNVVSLFYHANLQTKNGNTVYRETFEEESFRETGEIEDFAEKTFVGQWPVNGAHAHAPQNSRRKLSRVVPNPRNS